jgi:hypothetical protein
MPITAKSLIPAIGMLLKHIFRGSQKNQKNASFFVLYSAKRICKNTRWRLNKISKTGPAGHP